MRLAFGVIAALLFSSSTVAQTDGSTVLICSGELYHFEQFGATAQRVPAELTIKLERAPRRIEYLLPGVRVEGVYEEKDMHYSALHQYDTPLKNTRLITVSTYIDRYTGAMTAVYKTTLGDFLAYSGKCTPAKPKF